MKENQFVILKSRLPQEVKEGGKALTICYSYAATTLGELLIASTARGVCYLAFVTTTREAVLRELKNRFPRAHYQEQSDAYQQQALALVEREEPATTTPLPLHLTGTDFQLEVWSALLQIPFGATTSYGELAQKLNRERACRAVGTAVGQNPISILIPCHRVLRASGALGGYHWGLERKIALLGREAKLTSANKKSV